MDSEMIQFDEFLEQDAFDFVNQASHLPNEVNSTILNINKLNSQSSTTVWQSEVMSVLRPLKLEGLIDSDLARPEPTDSQYSKWRFWGPVIARWLLNQLEEPIQQLVKSHTPYLTYADDVYNTIKSVNLGNHRLYIERELAKWNNLKRADYTKAQDFILAYQNQYNRLKMEGEEGSCGLALARLLNELEAECIRVPFIRSEVDAMAKEVDYPLFNYYCRLLIRESREALAAGTGGGFDTGRGGGDGGQGSSSATRQEISYRAWRRGEGRQPR
ncbi:unnamed protein product [Penicillium salamii]|uniref:Uncharacterized protein n=1 Tax=Penicillium salamii TaxID=1612424 RepID=A0A9W4J9X0_9EURO|nr:unnamed protein product [Penicillium salamii]CAG8128042.1 unnamed protein product [Penicillium salamii]CAG8220709.1 unnamed protein product [Penicillium salamii]CAG8324783.1 unnamed protein product [Penicillium salamii]CAG8373016.1 unnamed protein product [Penicillium salamii]